MAYRISVDASGTSAQGVLVNEEGGAIGARAAVVPLEPAAGALSCLEKLAEETGVTLPELLTRTGTIVLGSDIARAVVDERSGARVGTLATQGFRTRMVFEPLPDSACGGRHAAVLTDGHRMTEVVERVDARGKVLVPLDEESVVGAVRSLKRQQVESIAVLLLFSPLYRAHEQRVGEMITEEFPGVHVALSSAILPVVGEFQRWHRTLLSAYVAPAVSSYVAGISGLLREKGFAGELLFKGEGGETSTPEAVVENPCLLLGPETPALPPSGGPRGLPKGFRDLLSLDVSGGARIQVGFHPGSGAREGCDGSPGVGFASATEGSLWADVEHCETHCPVMVDEVRLLQDGEGAGEYRGAPGVCVEVTLLAAAKLRACPGGGEVILCRPHGVCRPLRAGAPQPVAPGDRCVTRCTGSEGWGNPLDRSVSRVQRDVIGGYVSVERARAEYGVVLNPSTLELQCDETLKLRDARRSQRTERQKQANRSPSRRVPQREEQR